MYAVLEYVGGGELFTLLRNEGAFGVTATIFYVVEVSARSGEERSDGATSFSNRYRRRYYPSSSSHCRTSTNSR